MANFDDPKPVLSVATSSQAHASEKAQIIDLLRYRSFDRPDDPSSDGVSSSKRVPPPPAESIRELLEIFGYQDLYEAMKDRTVNGGLGKVLRFARKSPAAARLGKVERA